MLLLEDLRYLIIVTRVVHGRLTEPEPKTGVFGEKTGTENRGSKTGDNRKPVTKTARFRFIKYTPKDGIFWEFFGHLNSQNTLRQNNSLISASINKFFHFCDNIVCG